MTIKGVSHSISAELKKENKEEQNSKHPKHNMIEISVHGSKILTDVIAIESKTLPTI